ncbi:MULTISPECIES: glutathione S-transferase N-terminal domain-containing protein [unclassified Adlercreutzia]|uniref:glutathione S-transferase N-terminal domain-containing protein n=1 Tax=unclassified Adlercreutzia TaxID=2636013 RepID=UPI0013E9D123|nr:MULTISPECIES: glutathione S-transferase N-terminal domain-containing protein [unclassified Adlercreutzia]
METPILYHWAPCATCSVTSQFADEHGIALDKRDVELEQPYQELLALGGDANLIPYLYAEGQLIQGNDAIIAYLTEHFC